MPFGKSGTEAHKKNSRRYNKYLKPTLEEFSNDVKRADEFDHLGNINKDIIENLFYSHIVIADLSGGNANVFYELGVRHALKKNSTIPIAKKGESIPFDNSTYRTIFFDDDADGLVILQSELRSKIIASLNQSVLHIDNPVHDSLENKISDMLKDNLALTESHNNYEKECERLRKVVAQQNGKINELIKQMSDKDMLIERKEHLLKVHERNINKGKSIITNSKFLNVEESYWYNNILESKNSFIGLISAKWVDNTNSIKEQITNMVEQYDDHFMLVYFDLEKIEKLANELGIKTLPTVLFIKNGQVVNSFTGPQRDETYQGAFNRIYD